MKKLLGAAICSFALPFAPAQAEPGDCVVPPTYINGYRAEVEGTMTIKAGKGCGFGMNGIEGAISEAVIVQKPKVGMAGVRGLMPFYVAKPGYQGNDEFSYAFIGTDRYGGPMRVTIKRKVTVIP